MLVRPVMEGKIQAVVSINAPLLGKKSHPLDPIRVPLSPSTYRAAWLVSVEPKHQGDDSRELFTCEMNGERHVVRDYPAGAVHFEGHSPAVSFVHQLSHRARIFDQVITSYLGSDLRRVVQGLDQLLKLSVSLEDEEMTSWVHSIKVKFLHLGRFEPEDFKKLIRYAFHAPFALTSEGVWERQSKPQ